jgi:hypothetical protein
MAAAPQVISDDHRRDRALTAFCHMIAIHGLTTIAHHCSILITTRIEGNVSSVLRASVVVPDCHPENQENRSIRAGG